MKSILSRSGVSKEAILILLKAKIVFGFFLINKTDTNGGLS